MCHVNHGRGELPITPNSPMDSAAIIIGLNGTGTSDPIYGGQIQTFAKQRFTSSDIKSGLPVYQGSINGNELFEEAFFYWI